jgi:bifunctional non-homologous end joining protein LigD
MPSEVLMRTTGRSVRLTHPDKVLVPEGAVTKADLAEWFRDVAPVMLPHVRRRPVSLQRFNGGIRARGIFQKELPKGAPAWIHRVRVPKEGGTVLHGLADDAWTGPTASSSTSTRRARTTSRSWCARRCACATSSRTPP